MTSGRDLSGPIKKATIAALKAAPGVSAIAGERSYDYVATGRTYPYTRCTTTIVTPFEATGGVKGSLILVQVDAFTKEYGTDQVNALNDAISEALDGADLVLSEGYTLDLTWLRSQVFGDPAEQGVNHGVIEFEALASV